MADFTGFTREAIDFLADLAQNNDRAWFQPRKAEYERLLKQPVEDLCVALAEVFAARDLPLVADPGRSPFRIYRDVRFSKDKSPYKTAVAASFPWRDATRDDRMGAYFHFEPGRMSAGGGMWHPEPKRLTAWRTLVATDPARVHAAVDDAGFLATVGPVRGEMSARVPTGYPKDHPDADLLRLKDIIWSRDLSDADVLSPGLPDTLATLYAASLPMLRLLAELPVAE